MEECVKLVESISARIDGATTPININVNGKPNQWGTGTLFGVAEKWFVVTAKHVVDSFFEDESRGIWIFDNVSNPKEVPLKGRVLRTIDDVYDLAIWDLDLDVIIQLPNRSPLRLGDVAFEPDPPRGHYGLFGFPAALGGQVDATTFRLQRFCALAPKYTGETSKLGSYDPTHHLLLDLPKNDIIARSGEPAVLPHLGGISGCSIWYLIDPNLPPSHWKADHARVVGVETGVYRDGAIVKATRWKSVAQILWANYPELRPAMRFYLG